MHNAPTGIPGQGRCGAATAVEHDPEGCALIAVRRVVVDHVLFVVNDLEASRRLYMAALAPLGYEELHVQENGVHYGPEGLDDFAIYQGSPVTTAAHVAFDAATKRPWMPSSTPRWRTVRLLGASLACGRSIPTATTPPS